MVRVEMTYACGCKSTAYVPEDGDCQPLYCSEHGAFKKVESPNTEAPPNTLPIVN